ncbi:hypothetical protein SUDANB120_06482 (plasmid) [Streptomyces sp. enrichment culture]|nr:MULTISPECIES: DUF3291 domain-containing protein [Streptomyces]GGS92952.1 hypothetical protein GCM10010286_17210 [Streptomyces toxytricini]
MPKLTWKSSKPVPADTRTHIMASRFEVKSLADVPRFFVRALAAWAQLKTSRGAVEASLIAEPLKRTFWTLSAWESREAIHGYARAEPHRGIMRELRSTMRTSVFTFWELPAGELPLDWDDARARLAAQLRADAENA